MTHPARHCNANPPRRTAHARGSRNACCAHDARGVPGGITSLQQTRSYDQNYWIDRIESSLAEGLQADFTLDVVGNISAIAGAGGAPVNGYSYDDLYRLTSESAPGLSLAHAYDATGNRTAETVAGATTVYAYPPDSHRLTNIGRTARTFDAAGNLRVLNSFNRSSPEYTYDDRNRMAAYRVGSRDVATYAHNARGERVHKSAPKAGSATLFVYAEGGQLLGEYDADGSVLQEYAWLDALPVAVLKKGGPYPLEPDHLGTPRRAIAAELDRAVWAWDLQGPAFGTHPANDDPDADGQPFPLNLRFPGQYLDAESNLHYNYFRDYDPATGRYVESDPVGLRGGLGTYRYAYQDPMRYLDDTGLAACTPMASWLGFSWSDTTTVALDDGQWELRNAHAFMYMTGIPLTRIRLPIQWGADCFAVFVRSYEDTTRTYATRYTMEYCVDGCDSWNQWIQIRDETEYLGKSKRRYKKVDAQMHHVVKINVGADAMWACNIWIESLR